MTQAAPTLLPMTVLIDTAEQLDDGSTGDDGCAHYIDQRIGTGQDVSTAIIEGTELVALCGYRWVPWRDPRKLPVCKRCADVLASIIGGGA